MTAANSDPQQVLRDEIIADARKQAERTIARAQRAAQELIARGRAEAEKERAQRLDAAKAEADRKRELLLATVPVEVTRRRAARVEALLEQLRREALDRLQRRDGFDYFEVLVRLAVHAVSRMDGQEFILSLSQTDLQPLGERLAAEVRGRVGRDGLNVQVDAAPASISGGVIVRDLAGRQVWDNSFEGRLRRFWPVIRNELADRILPAPRAAGKEV